MAHPVTTQDTLAALESNAQSITAYFSTLPDRTLFQGDSDRWGPAHQLIHLTRTSAAIERGLRSNALPLHSSGRSRSYAEVRDAATKSLVSTPKDKLLDMGRVVVIPEGATRADLVNAFATAGAALRDAAAAWAEADLDRHAMSHPLIGELTVREMLMFCVVHERHHLRSVREFVEAGLTGGAS